MPMHSPATNFKAHERAIQDLVVKAYRQCRRFIEYLDSAAEVPIYRLADGVYTEIGRLKRADYRSILPIGLRSEEHTSELQSLMRNSYAAFCSKTKNNTYTHNTPSTS